MIGPLDIDEPEWPVETVQLVEHHRHAMNQDYVSILLFGLWNNPMNSTEARVYAGFKYLTQNPGDGAHWLLVARLLCRLGNHALGGSILEALGRAGGLGLEQDVLGENLYANTALILADAGRADKALSALVPLEAEFNSHPAFRVLRGSLLQDVGEPEAARTQFNAAIQELEALDPIDEDALGVEVDRLLVAVRAWRDQVEAGPFRGVRTLDLIEWLQDDA